MTAGPYVFHKPIADCKESLGAAALGGWPVPEEGGAAEAGATALSLFQMNSQMPAKRLFMNARVFSWAATIPAFRLVSFAVKKGWR